MAKIKIETEVSKETYELGVGLGRVVAKMREALKDGWQTGSDLPVAVSAAITDLVPAVEGIDQIDDEIKEDPAAFSRAIVIPMSDVVAEALTKEESEDGAE